ncbi:type I methionyl aminopeptidase [Candidatus Woesebacteria bacterium]|nr:type I methionyl aminopeptidase [Candidatus Woesebacteria bacterium]
MKTNDEIESMKRGGAILRDVMKELVPEIKAGMTTNEIDRMAEDMILARGGESSFKRVEGYKWTTCLPVNEQTVHTPPSDRVLKDGDVLTVDIGVYLDGLHTDYADTFVIGGTTDEKTQKFLDTGREALEKAVRMVHCGMHLGEIGAFMQKQIMGNGYFILKELTGHGVGRELHEDPYVMNYVDRPVEKTYKIPSGLTIAVEIIYSMGTERIAYEPHVPWSIITKDKSLSACFERSIAITDKDTFILT